MSASAKPPVPPKISWKPGKVKVVRALYKYTAQRTDELSFEEGDLLYVYDKDVEPNWWKGKCGKKEGLIPANYVEEQTEEVVLPLHDAARRGNLSFLKELLIQGVSGTSLDAVGNTPLYWAAKAGHLDCVNELLNLPTPAINAQNKTGDTPLHAAASRGYFEIVSLLLKHGADPTLKNTDGHRPEDLSFETSIKNALQLSQRHSNGVAEYDDDDYNDESD